MNTKNNYTVIAGLTNSQSDLLGKIIDTTPTGILIVNAAGEIVFANTFAEHILALSKSDLQHRTYTDLQWQITDYEGNEFPESQLPFFLVKEKMEAVYNVRYALMLPDGSRKLLKINASPLRTEAGNFDGMVAHIEDVTEQVLAEQELRKSEERFKNLIETTSDWIWEMDCKGNFTYVSPRCEQILGYTPEEVVNGSGFDLMPEDEAQKIRGKFEKYVNKKLPFFGLININRHKDGHEVYIESTGVPFFDTQGNLLGYRGSDRDITERLKDHEEMRKRENLLNSVFRAAPVGIGVVTDRVIVWTNDKMHQMTGYGPEELREKSARMLYPTQEDYEYVGTEKYRQIQEQGTGTVETRWVRKDGKVIDILLSSTPIDLQDLSKGVTFTALEITERRELEEQLRQSEKMQAVGQLAGGIAHDFNNQLTGILGNGEMLQEELAHSPQLREYTESILISTRRAADLTSQLLAFARKGKYLSLPIDLHSIILEVISLLQHAIDKRIEITMQLSDSDCTITGDPSQVQNALLNLALNARDAMPEGGILTFTTEKVLVEKKETKHFIFPIEAGRYVRVRVSDTGVGIPPEVQLKMFEPFFTTKPEGKGTGMGLAAVYGTLKNHGGTIEVQTEKNKGTQISLYFPDQTNDKTPESALHVDSHVRKAPRASRILIVDDEPLVGKMASTMLTRLGYEPVVCANGKEALSIFKREREKIDLVILDMVMPVMNGRDAFLKLRLLNPNIPILIASGYAVDQQTRKLLSEKFCAFIKKPFRKAEIAKKIEELLL